MGFGNVLGGVATGLQAADELALEQQRIDAANKAAAADAEIARQNLALKQLQLADTRSRDAQVQVNRHIADTVKLVAQIIKNGQAAGSPPDKLMNSVAPLLNDVDAWGARTGQDTSKLREGITAYVQAGGAPSPKVGQTLEGIKAKLARGEKLTPPEQKLYDDSLHQNSLQGFLKETLTDAVISNLASPTAAGFSLIPPANAAPPGATAKLPNVLQGIVGEGEGGTVGDVLEGIGLIGPNGIFMQDWRKTLDDALSENPIASDLSEPRL
jgi:hypothetical protein